MGVAKPSTAPRKRRVTSVEVAAIVLAWERASKPNCETT